MVAGATLLLAALVSTPRAPVSTYELPVCDERTSVPEEPIDAVEVEEEPANQSPDQSIGIADGCENEALPTVVDCNDARASVWVQEMIGSCDMPRSPTALRAAPRPEGRPSAACDGAGCAGDRMPVRAAARAADPSQSLDASALVFALDLPSTRFSVEDPARPRSAASARLERPPRIS